MNNDYLDYLAHAQGTKWKNHKYIAIQNGRYIYDESELRKKSDTNPDAKGARMIGGKLYYGTNEQLDKIASQNSKGRNTKRFDNNLAGQQIKKSVGNKLNEYERNAQKGYKDIKKDVQKTKKAAGELATDVKNEVGRQAYNAANEAKYRADLAKDKLGTAANEANAKMKGVYGEPTVANAKKKATDKYNEAKRKADEANAAAREKATQTKEQAVKKYNAAKNELGSAAREANRKMTGRTGEPTVMRAKQKAKEAYNDAKNEVGRQAYNAKNEVKYQAERAKQKAVDKRDKFYGDVDEAGRKTREAISSKKSQAKDYISKKMQDIRDNSDNAPTEVQKKKKKVTKSSGPKIYSI